MEHWITMLREQAAQIAGGNYVPGTPAFTRAPPGMVELSQDLDNLALVFADRARVQKTLTREVHHRVKNNLQIISSLLRMQARNVQDPAVSEALHHAHSRMGVLAMIHRLVYEQSDECTQGSLDLDRLMAELCAIMRIWYRDRIKVKYFCDSSAVSVPLDSALPLGLFAVEAVSNVYSHAFPGRNGGEVSLKFSVDGDEEAELCVTDNGVGFDAESETGAMGFQLMNAFAHELGGTFDITSSAQTGTEIRLSYHIGRQALPPEI